MQKKLFLLNHSLENIVLGLVHLMERKNVAHISGIIVLWITFFFLAFFQYVN